MFGLLRTHRLIFDERRAHPHATFYVAGASPFVSSTADLLRVTPASNWNC